MKKVTPKTFLIGAPCIDEDGIVGYLKESDNLEFAKMIQDARRNNISDAVILSSFFAKLCYKSLTTKHNDNISKVRDIEDNIKNVLQTGHGSVLEHSCFNFVTTNCSRVFTHELCRHRAGFAFSQTSGRYVRSDELDMILDDPILKKYDLDKKLCGIASVVETYYNNVVDSIFKEKEDMPFSEKKKITSALRRILPNGQANEIGWSCNIRALRHVIMMRTSRHAEWEIRKVFSDVYHLCKNHSPLLFSDAKETNIDGLLEITNMQTQPY